MPLGLSLGAFRSNYVSTVAPYANTKSLAFDGTDAIAVLDNNKIQTLLRDSFTYAFWLHDSFLSSSELGGFEITTGTAQNFRLRYLPIAPGVNFIILQFKANNNGSQHVINKTLSANTWHHIAVTVQKATGANTATMKLYVDGVAVGSSYAGPTGTAQAAFAATSTLRWGVGAYWNDSNSNDFAGYTSATFDEVAFWSKALPAEDIGVIYNAGNGTFDLTEDYGSYDFSDHLQYYYRFEDDYTDTKGAGGDAYVQGTPTFVSSPTPP